MDDNELLLTKLELIARELEIQNNLLKPVSAFYEMQYNAMKNEGQTFDQPKN